MRCLIFLALLAAAAHAQTDVDVVVSPSATAVEKFAAAELSDHLQLLYPRVRFRVAGKVEASRKTVLVGVPTTSREVARHIKPEQVNTPESFVVTTSGAKNASTAIVAGADPRGVLFAAYALLEKLGFGFYLSYSTHPPAIEGPFSFDSWQLADRPLTATRLVLNWHNFLSGCSTWGLPEWQRWITQASRMRFNAIMVHAYGNNPMFSFTHNGVEKPAGYLSTTARGRDWGTEHVTDVRRIVGGEKLFDSPVFGSSAGLVPEGQTTQAAVALMRKVFQFAGDRGMGVTFALDVDTVSSNPQNVIATLPAHARFSTQGGVQLANPETAEGYAYYHSQIEQLLRAYPQITQIAIWFRGERTSPWRGLRPEGFPGEWRTEYEQKLRSRPDLRGNPNLPSMFAVAKIAVAYRKILDETGHSGVTLSAGSWNFEFLLPADAFMPPGVALIPLDYSYQFASDPVQEAIRAVTRNRAVIPVVWAQHDDRSYAGRPYLPFSGFASLLRSSDSAGFGIIHWTTRPLDLYFKSLADQVWNASENEPLGATCERMAWRTFGARARDLGTKYLLDWIQDAPMFGRETTDAFIDQYLLEAPVLQGSRKRLDLLGALRPLARAPEASAWVDYYEDWEKFTRDFYRAHAGLQRSLAALKRGDDDQARRELADVSPELVLRQYARTIAHGGATRGEKGILVSMNLRWLPYFVAQRQVLGLEPLRIRFAPTSHEELAQAPGRYTYAFDPEGRLTMLLGSTETGAQVEARVGSDACSGGLKLDRPVSLRLRGLAGRSMPAGEHRLKLDLSPASRIEVSDGRTAQVATSGSAVPVTAADGVLTLSLKPIGGAASVCGVVLGMED